MQIIRMIKRAKKLKFYFYLTVSLIGLCIACLTYNLLFAADKITDYMLGGSFYPTYPQLILQPGDNLELIAQGEYLVKVGDCISCHTNTAPGSKPFAGSLPLKTPFGTFFGPNITPDKETGIGNWTTQDFINAMHKGIRPDGQNLFPVFPYTSFTRVTTQDLIAIKAYLDRIPAVKQKNKPPTAPWPFSWRLTQTFWKWLFFDEGFYQFNPNKTLLWNRGAYLVQGLGHCGECHTPRNFMGAMKQQYYLTGAFIEGYWAPDITGIEFSDTPISNISEVFANAELINKAGPVRGPMAEVDHNSLMFLTKSDLDAIALYLKTVKSPQPRLPYGLHGKVNQAEGKKVYLHACAMCHDRGEMAAPMIYDTANWNMRLKKGLKVLYDHAIDGYNQMPPMGNCLTCTKPQIKQAVDYILANSQETSTIQRIKEAKTPPPDTSIALGEKIYKANCALCHDQGQLGAPVLTNREVWVPILKKNLDILIGNTIHGMHNMPPKGGCTQCTNAEIIAAVKYMAQQANPDADYSLW